VALSIGWSLTGNQVLADSGWPSAIAPSSVCRKPPSPKSGLWIDPGLPEYPISTVNSASLTIPSAGVTTSSASSRLSSASAPLTFTESTERPTRSRLNLDRSSVAAAVIVAVPVSSSVPGSYLTTSL
jgi:hypothetical protein